MKTQLNPQATHHIGEIHYQDSSTPIGVNFYGLTFEDANYELAAISADVLTAFESTVIEGLKSGETCGTFDGKPWRYTGRDSCHNYSSRIV